MPDGIAQALFAPRSIALVGASADEAKHTSLPQRYLRRHGYDKPIYPVNPSRAEIFGERAYRTVGDIGQPVDHAFIMVPNPAVLAAVQDCARAGVRVASILTNGFAESGERGRALQETIMAEARKHGLRILGPNSLGVVSVADRTALSANEVLSLPRLEAGRYGLISQSGSLMGALISRGQARGFGFSRIVSVGNEADLGVAEIGHFLIDDPHTDVILLFLETIRDAPSVAAMARRAFDASKPMLAFRLGRSALGATLAAAHTGALIADGRTIDAFLEDNGIVRVSLFETLLELPTLLVGRRPARGKRVAVLTTTGGGGGLVVDSLGERGVEIVAPGEAVISALRAKDIAIGSSALIDLTLAGTNARIYGAVLGELLASPSCNMVIGVVGSSSQFRPDRAVEPIIAAAKADPRKPIAVFLTPQADEAFALLHRNGVAAFLSPESCADAVRAYLAWRSPRPIEAARKDVAALAALGARELFLALGIEHPAETRIDPRHIDEADVSGLTFPVVAKIASRDVAHKTEAGGVVLGIRTAEELKEACRRMLATVRSRRPDARIEAIQAQSMERGLAEVLVGYRRDPQVGPTVTVGAGGVLAEIYRDVAVRLAPVDHATARAMIDEVRGLAPLRGYRSLPRGDLDALARAICALSSLASLECVFEAEINPLLVKREGEGVVALDGLVVKEE